MSIQVSLVNDVQYRYVPRSVNMTMSNAPHLRLLGAFLVYLFTFLGPVLTKDAFGQLAGTAQARKIALFEQVHDLVRSREHLVLQGRVARDRVRKLAECLEVPQELPSVQIRDNDVGRLELEESVHLQGEREIEFSCWETHVWQLDDVAGPQDSKHAVAAGLDHEPVLSCLDGAGRDDVLDTAVTAGPAGDALEGDAIGREYHSFASRVELD